MLSLYWVTGTISTMGQGAGELMPQNREERLFTIFLMLLNLSVYAYLLGAISQLFMTADEALVEIREEVTLIESYLNNNDFGSNLEYEIRGTVKANALTGMGKGGLGAMTISTEESQKLFDSLSHTLKVDVAKFTNFNLLTSVHAFKSCNQNFLESVSTVLKEDIIKPNSFIFRVNEPSMNFYVIASGTVQIISEEEDDEDDEGGGGDDKHEKEGKKEKKNAKMDKMRTAAADDELVVEKNTGDVLGEIPFFFNTRHTNSAKTSVTSLVKMYAHPNPSTIITTTTTTTNSPPLAGTCWRRSSTRDCWTSTRTRRSRSARTC
jgi:CRP-like cAMP-binding protein